MITRSIRVNRTINRSITTSSVNSIKLDNSTINSKVINAQYAVRGEIPVKADIYGQQIRDGNGDKLPFKAIMPCNVGIHCLIALL